MHDGQHAAISPPAPFLISRPGKEKEQKLWYRRMKMSSSSCLCEMTQTQEPVTPTRNLQERKKYIDGKPLFPGGQMQRSRTTRYARAPARARCLSHTWNLLPSASHWPTPPRPPGSFPPHEDKPSGRHLISQCPVCDLFPCLAPFVSISHLIASGIRTW